MNAVDPHGLPTVNSSRPLKSRELKVRSVNGPCSWMMLPLNESQLKNELVERYRNSRNKFWFKSTGSVASCRIVYCTPVLNRMEFLPKRSTGFNALLNV